MGQVTCSYCGASLDWNGPGAQICPQCGATQPEPQAAVAYRRKRILRYAAIPVIVAALVWLGFLLFSTKHVSPSAPAPIINGNSAATTVPGTRIIRVDNPAIRIIPAGVHFEAQDVLDTPNGSAELPQFDTRLLVTTHAPRHLREEGGGSVYLGEVRNDSPDMVAITPDVTLVLMRKGREVGRATRSYADLVPGIGVPFFFHYDDGAAAAFDEARLQWKPTKSYKLGDSKHAQFLTTVQPGLPRESSGQRVTTQVSGSVQNTGKAAAAVSLYAILRDANGLITGFEHSDLPRMKAGESRNVSLTVYTYGSPGARAELAALPVSEATL